jgi:phage anti-repressor protein
MNPQETPNSDHSHYSLALPITSGWVDARNLHGHLSPGRNFPTWFKSRCEEYEFTEGVDFHSIEFCPVSGKNTRGRPRFDYKLTLSMAKELCMVERSETGRAVRKYFIQAEEELRRIQENHSQRNGYFAPHHAAVLDFVSSLIALGTTPDLAVKCAMKLGFTASRQLQNSLHPAEIDTSHPIDVVLDLMQQDVEYRIPDLISLLPEHHDLRKKESTRSRDTRIGHRLEELCRIGKLVRVKARFATFRLPSKGNIVNMK